MSKGHTKQMRSAQIMALAHDKGHISQEEAMQPSYLRNSGPKTRSLVLGLQLCFRTNSNRSFMKPREVPLCFGVKVWWMGKTVSPAVDPITVWHEAGRCSSSWAEHHNPGSMAGLARFVYWGCLWLRAVRILDGTLSYSNELSFGQHQQIPHRKLQCISWNQT